MVGNVSDTGLVALAEDTACWSSQYDEVVVIQASRPSVSTENVSRAFPLQPLLVLIKKLTGMTCLCD